MKYSLLTLSVFCLAVGAFGQRDAADRTPQIQKHQNPPSAALAKTTALTERLSAIATYKAGVGFTDSVTYGYYGIRGSKFDFNAMKYYDSSNLTNILFDTAVYYKYVSGNILKVKRVGGEYDASNNLLAQRTAIAIAPNFLQNLHSDSFFYNTNHTISRQRHYTWASASVFDTAGEKLYAYNTLGQVSQDVSYVYTGNFSFNPASMNNYVYNAAGKQDTITRLVYTAGSWKNSSRIYFDYYPGNLLRKYTIQTYVGTAWVNSTKDSFGYGAFNFYNYHEHQTWTGSAWANNVKETRHANAQGVTDVQSISTWNSTTMVYYPPTTISWVYDTLLRPVRSVRYDSVGNFADSMKYYYQTYNNPVTVPEAVVIRAIVYPNPARNTLYIKWDAANGAPEELNILNVQGQLVKSRYTTGEKETAINVADLTPGMYWIRGVNKGGNVNYNASFLKQ